MRVLIAEDETVSRRILEAMLQKWGHEVVSACDGNAAWEALRAPDAPRMVILDWMMPGMDGIEVCRKVRQLETEVRPHIIMLTGRENKKDLVEGINAGADDYVTKPFDPDELRVRIQAGERIIQLQLELLAGREALRYQATHDALTGLLNRSAILQAAEREFLRSERTGQPVSLVLLDIDHFKDINDNYSHAVGDAVLVELAHRTVAKMRPYEDFGRLGGEEFLAVLSPCDWPGAGRMAERVRAAIADEEFQIEGMRIPVTASFGVAASTQLSKADPERLLKLADAALYRAKRNGRDRVELATSVATACGPAITTYGSI